MRSRILPGSPIEISGSRYRVRSSAKVLFNPAMLRTQVHGRSKCKTDGVMPGFQIRDQKGDSYILKFDPPGYLELSTAADVIASKFLYAAGYNVPENFIVIFDEHILVPDNNLVCTGAQREQLSSNPNGLATFLQKLPHTEQGQLRAMASRFIE